MPVSSKGSYTKPPTYQDEPKTKVNMGASPYLSYPGAGDGGVGGVPTSPPAPVLPPNPAQAGAGDAGVGGQAAGQQQQAQPPASIGGLASDRYGGMLSQYLDQAFGSGRSFEPMAQQITGQRDDALRSMAEQMASRGLGNSGALASGAGDIYNKAGQNLASSYQDWRQQGVQNMQSAISPFLEEQLSAQLLGEGTSQKGQLADYLSNIKMSELFGTDRNPTMGTAEAEALYNLLLKGEPSGKEATALEDLFWNSLPANYESEATAKQVSTPAVDQEIVSYNSAGLPLDKDGILVKKK